MIGICCRLCVWMCVHNMCVFFCSARSTITRLAWDEKGPKKWASGSQVWHTRKEFHIFVRGTKLSWKSCKSGTERFLINQDSQTYHFWHLYYSVCCIYYINFTQLVIMHCFIFSSFTGLQLLYTGLDTMQHFHLLKKKLFQHHISIYSNVSSELIISIVCI